MEGFEVAAVNVTTTVSVLSMVGSLSTSTGIEAVVLPAGTITDPESAV